MPLDLAASTAKGQRPLLCFAFCESPLLIGPSAIQSPKTGYRYGTVGWTCRHQLSPIIAPSSRSSVVWAGTRAKAHPGTAYLGCTYVQRTSSPCRQRRGLDFVSETALWQPSSRFGLSTEAQCQAPVLPRCTNFRFRRVSSQSAEGGIISNCNKTKLSATLVRIHSTLWDEVL